MALADADVLCSLFSTGEHQVVAVNARRSAHSNTEAKLMASTGLAHGCQASFLFLGRRFPVSLPG